MVKLVKLSFFTYLIQKIFLDPILHTILDACMPADRANIFLTLEEVMKEKCLDHVATLVGLDEKKIEEDFKAVDTDEDGKVTLEEGLKVYQYLRETSDSTDYGMCVYDCCVKFEEDESQQCQEIEEGPESLEGSCEAKIETVPQNLLGVSPNVPLVVAQLDCTLKATAWCKEDGNCTTTPSSIESGEVGFLQG